MKLPLHLKLELKRKRLYNIVTIFPFFLIELVFMYSFIGAFKNINLLLLTCELCSEKKGHLYIIERRYYKLRNMMRYERKLDLHAMCIDDSVLQSFVSSIIYGN